MPLFTQLINFRVFLQKETTTSPRTDPECPRTRFSMEARGNIMAFLMGAVTYFRNKRMTEGALRNTHLEISEVKGSLSMLMKRRARACRCGVLLFVLIFCSELIRWAENVDDKTVLQMITTLGELEVRSNALAQGYVEKYKEFSEVFREILFERQELHGELLFVPPHELQLSEGR